MSEHQQFPPDATETMVQQELPLAIVEGKPLNELPKDLYIPPDALEVFLEAFDGPLDLLLYLIRRQNMDILDIDVSAITRLYMGYIALIDSLRVELSADYHVMQAMLAVMHTRIRLATHTDTGD